MSRRPLEKQAREAYRMARYASIGLELGVSVIIGMGVGWWADEQLDSSPVGLLIGIGLGFTAAIRSIHRTLSLLSDSDAEETEAENEE